MEWLHTVLLILAAVLALSGLIASKSADAKKMVDKLVPYQAMIGVGLLSVGLIQLLRVGPINLFRTLGHLFGIAMFVGIVGGILLGFMFGMPQIAKWIPGESSAEQKAQDLSRKLAPYQLILGALCGGAGVIFLLIQLHILKPF